MNQVVSISQVDKLSGGRVLIRFNDGKVAIHTAADLYQRAINEADVWQECQEECLQVESDDLHCATAGGVSVMSGITEAPVSP